MRRFVVPGLVIVVAAALLALLAFGVANQGTSSSIDAKVQRGELPVAPSANMALPVLGEHRHRAAGAAARQGRDPQRVRLLV